MLDFLVHLVGYMLVHLSNGKSLNLLKVILMCLHLFNGRLLQDLLWIFLMDTIEMIGSRGPLQPEPELILKKHRVARDDRRPHYLVNALELTLVHGLIILLNPALIHHRSPHPVWRRCIISRSPIQGSSGRVRCIVLPELDGAPEGNRLRLYVAPLRGVVALNNTPIHRGSPTGRWIAGYGLKVALAGFLLEDNIGLVLGGHLEGVTERQQKVFRALLLHLHELIHEVLGRRTSFLLAASHRD